MINSYVLYMCMCMYNMSFFIRTAILCELIPNKESCIIIVRKELWYY